MGKKIQWHPAFVSATEWELKANRKDLEFDREHYLNQAPIHVDLLVIKVKPKAKIKNEIGHIFREHNLVEYKGEGDDLNIDVFYKGLAYACLYKSSGEEVDSIKDDAITLSFVRHAYPRDLIRDLKARGYAIYEKYPSIYYVQGGMFPIQIIVTKDLDEEKHSALKILTNKAKEADVRRFIEEAKTAKLQGDKDNIDAILQVSVSANKKLYSVVREEKKMCDALRDLMKDEIDEEIRDEKDKTEKSAKIEAIKNIMDGFKVSAEQAMDVMKIPKKERKAYFAML